MRFGADGRLYAINPEAGFFGVAPGTSAVTNPNALEDAGDNTIFTNVALTDDGDVWWEGLTERAAGPPDRLAGPRLDARVRAPGRPSQRPLHRAAPPSARRSPRSGTTRPGVPISAILFGGRRATAVPLVTEAFSWQHGVFLGATVASETTAAGRGPGRASCATTRSRCCRSAATTWATTSATG